jgi:hypothetical protein
VLTWRADAAGMLSATDPVAVVAILKVGNPPPIPQGNPNPGTEREGVVVCSPWAGAGGRGVVVRANRGCVAYASKTHGEWGTDLSTDDGRTRSCWVGAPKQGSRC